MDSLSRFSVWLVTSIIITALASGGTEVITEPDELHLNLPTVNCSEVEEADTGGFLGLMMELEHEGITHSLDIDLKVLPFEILTAAQTDQLKETLDDIHLVRFFRVLDGLTAKYSHQFIRFLVLHLDEELCANLTITS